MGDAVRLQYDPDLPREIVAKLVDELELTSEDLYPGRGFTAFTDLFQLYAAVNLPTSERPAADGRCRCRRSSARPDIWSAIRGGDVLAFHPYQSFDAVTRFVEEAAKDPKVLAIKMTLYRVSPTSPIAQALRARRRSRQRSLGARRAASALRRGGQHHLGARPGRSRRPRRLRPGRLQDPLQGVPRGAPGGRRHPALLPPGDRQLQRAHRRRLQRSRACSPAARSSARI